MRVPTIEEHQTLLGRNAALVHDLEDEKNNTQFAKRQRDDALEMVEHYRVVLETLPQISQNMLEAYPKALAELKVVTESHTLLKRAMGQSIVGGKYRITRVMQQVLTRIATE